VLQEFCGPVGIAGCVTGGEVGDGEDVGESAGGGVAEVVASYDRDDGSGCGS